MDKYDAANDHYCYPNTSTLKNKLNILNMADLENAEREITAITVQQVTFNPPPYDLAYMSKLHCQLFSELYEWAGSIRTVDISKGGTRFCTCTRIDAESGKLFASLQSDNWLKELAQHEFCEKLAEYYIEFNMIHPFREGNGRVQRLFFEHLALSAGYDLNWNDVNQSEWIKANVDGIATYEPIKKIFKRIVSRVS